MSQELFHQFYLDWLKSDRKLRLGQAFISAVIKIHGKHPFHDPALFYEEDYNKAYTLIFEKYIDQ